jgi:hypothetical protein
VNSKTQGLLLEADMTFRKKYPELSGRSEQRRGKTTSVIAVMGEVGGRQNIVPFYYFNENSS